VSQRALIAPMPVTVFVTCAGSAPVRDRTGARDRGIERVRRGDLGTAVAADDVSYVPGNEPPELCASGAAKRDVEPPCAPACGDHGDGVAGVQFVRVEGRQRADLPRRDARSPELGGTGRALERVATE